MRKKFFILSMLLSLGLILISLALTNTDSGGLVPEPENNNAPISFRLRLHESQSSFGIAITPETVLEDSRCPTDVACIQAGRVRLEASVQDASGARREIFTSGQALIVGAYRVTLADVKPDAISGQALPSSDYQFVFSLTRLE